MMKKDCLIMKGIGKIIYGMEKDIEDTGMYLVITTTYTYVSTNYIIFHSKSTFMVKL